MKHFLLFLAILCCAEFLHAQDFVVLNNGDVIRGTIRGTNNASVIIANGENQISTIEATDAQSFFWNGDSYISKGIAGRKNLDFKFLKVLELGKVNLYSLGGIVAPPEKQERRVKFRPSIGIGTGGSGFGGGITIGGNRNNQLQKNAAESVTHYFIEKPGSGPMQELLIKAITDPKEYSTIKAALIQKLGDNAEIKSQLENADTFNANEVKDFIETYNKQ